MFVEGREPVRWNTSAQEMSVMQSLSYALLVALIMPVLTGVFLILPFLFFSYLLG